MTFSEDKLKAMLEINQKYLETSDPKERKRLTEELISLVPDELKTPREAQMADVHREMKEEILQLAKVLETSDWGLYLEKLKQVQDKIIAHAEDLGAKIKGTDLEVFEKMLNNEVRKD